MIHTIPAVLSADDVAYCRAQLERATWIDGKVTAGVQSARAKTNLQIDQDGAEARAIGDLILDRLGAHPAFIAAALPARVFPPLFNRYEAGMGFDAHVDNAIRFGGRQGAPYRTDLSCTLFLNDPAEYEGGELQIEDQFGAPAVKLAAGDMVVYPASSVHRVTPITRGARLASFFWIQSMIRDDGQRALLHSLDQSIGETRLAMGDDHPAVLRLTGGYHNLLRMWAEF